MHDLRPDDDDQRESEGRADDAQGRVLGQVVRHFLRPLTGAVVVQSRVDALRGREVDGRELASHEGPRRRARRTERSRER